MQLPAKAPPSGFRPHMSVTVKLKAMLINGPVYDAAGDRVTELEAVDFDHDPPIQLRVWNEETQDTEPPANDPEYIFPRAREAHREKTAKVDVPRIAKTKRLARKQTEHVERMTGEKEKKATRWPKGKKIPSRPFERGKR